MSIYDDVKQSLNIREVIEHYGIKVGRNNSFCCPFHNEKHASASIKNDYFNCFACGVGGDLISFTARLHGISNYEACKKLAAEFGLSISTEPQTPIERLKADRERAKRQEEQKHRAEVEELINHTAIVLADYHRYLWQGKQYPFGHIRHTRALKWYDLAEYLCQCFDDNPEEYSINNREQVARIEARLHKWHHENE